jgi:predicted nucleotidyltransferase
MSRARSRFRLGCESTDRNGNSFLSIHYQRNRATLLDGGIMLTAEKVRAALEALSPTQEKVDLAVKTAVETAQPTRVIVFGSWPRGEAEWDSDLDLAVLLDDAREDQLGAIRRVLRRKLDEIPMSIDLVMATEGFAEQFRGAIGSIYYRILQDGHVAYEQRPIHASTNLSD